ncbi:MAG: ArsC family transcriptional regulator [Hyphomonas sp.]|nr:ArsC family transcriptional regulator [Hyphomonas sp.]
MPGPALTLYGLKNCDTCRKAKRELEASGTPVKFVDIRDEADLSAKLPVWLKAAPDKLVNKSSATWRNLTNSEKAKAGTNGEKALLAKHPTLIKRPVIEAGGDVHVGWGKDVQGALLG